MQSQNTPTGFRNGLPSFERGQGQVGRVGAPDKMFALLSQTTTCLQTLTPDAGMGGTVVLVAVPEKFESVSFVLNVKPNSKDTNESSVRGDLGVSPDSHECLNSVMSTNVNDDELSVTGQARTAAVMLVTQLFRNGGGPIKDMNTDIVKSIGDVSASLAKLVSGDDSLEAMGGLFFRKGTPAQNSSGPCITSHIF